MDISLYPQLNTIRNTLNIFGIFFVGIIDHRQNENLDKFFLFRRLSAFLESQFNISSDLGNKLALIIREIVCSQK